MRTEGSIVPSDSVAPEGGHDTNADDGLTPAGGPPELDAAQLAAIKAAKAAKKARKAQRQAEKARLLAAEYARVAETEDRTSPSGPADVDVVPAVVPDDETAAEADDVAAAEADDVTDQSPAAGRRTPLIVAAAVFVVALAFVVVAAVLHFSVGTSADERRAQLRDTVLLSARQDIVVLNTLDYRDIDAGLTRWSSASTGTLHQSLAHITATQRAGIAKAKSRSTAKVLAAAVVSLDADSGSATVIASVDLTVTPDSGKATVRRERIEADLSRTHGSWKVNSIGQVGVTVK